MALPIQTLQIASKIATVYLQVAYNTKDHFTDVSKMVVLKLMLKVNICRVMPVTYRINAAKYSLYFLHFGNLIQRCN
jgi:hypothetical protein